MGSVTPPGEQDTPGLWYSSERQSMASSPGLSLAICLWYHLPEEESTGRPEGRGAEDGREIIDRGRGRLEEGPDILVSWVNSYRAEESHDLALLGRPGLESGVSSRVEPRALAPEVEVVAITDMSKFIRKEGCNGRPGS